MIEAGYRIQQIQPIDIVPHTFHVETVCQLIRINAENYYQI